MWRLVWVAAFLGQIVHVWEGMWSLSVEILQFVSP